MDKSISVEVGKVCRGFRIEVLDLSLTDFSERVGLNMKNVNAFEYGRANSIHYLMSYLEVCNEEQFEILCERVFKLI